jgi:hypothetical protein
MIQSSMGLLDRTCERCGAQFRAHACRIARGHGRFCSLKCVAVATAARRFPNAAPRYKSIHVKGHPLATSTGLIQEHRYLLYEMIGHGSHPCHWCAAPVTWMPGARTRKGALVVDHVDRDTHNNAPENLVPSCQTCNIQRNRTDRVRDDEPYVLMTGQAGRHRAVPRTCQSCGAPFLHLAADRRPNRGRFCSRSCARRQPRRAG